MRDVLIRPGSFTSGAAMQRGLVVLRPGYVAFLPTGSKTHLVGGLASALAGVDGLSCPPAHYDVDKWMAAGGEVFDREVQRHSATGGLLWSPTDATLAVRPKAGAVTVRWLRSSLDILSTDVPLSTPVELIARWRLHRRGPMSEAELHRTLWITVGVTFVLAFPAGLVGYLTVVEQNPWMWLAVAFFMALPALLWGAWLTARREARRQASMPYDPSPPPSALSAWPKAPALSPAPHQAVVGERRLSFALVIRSLLGSIADVCAVLLVLSLAARGLEAVGIAAPLFLVPVVVVAEQVIALRKLGGLPGQRLVGVRVVSADGGRLTWRQALLRVVGAAAVWLMLMIGSIFAFVGVVLYSRKRDQMPHERWSRTRLEWAR